MSSVNFDASSGIGAGGQVNIVTRSGSNDFHGSGYFFFAITTWLLIRD